MTEDELTVFNHHIPGTTGSGADYDCVPYVDALAALKERDERIAELERRLGFHADAHVKLQDDLERTQRESTKRGCKIRDLEQERDVLALSDLALG